MGQLKYHNGTAWVPVEGSVADYSALIFNDLLTGTADGVNAVFYTTRNFASVSIYVNGQKQNPGALNDYTVTGANQITFTSVSIPPANAVITADLSTSASYTVTGTNSFVRKQAVTGLVNGINKDFVTAAAYVGGTLEVFVNGVRQKIADVTETNPGAGMFTLDTAPPSTPSVANVEVAYMVGGIASGNADTVDTFHASQSVAANTIPVSGSDGKLQYKTIPAIAFKARRSTNLSSAAGGTVDIAFDGLFYAVGGGYSTSTGLFTAPIDGVYMFNASAFTETTTTARSFFTPRGNANSGAVFGGVARSNERSQDIDSTYVRRVLGTWYIPMVAGETFGMSLYTNVSNQLNHQDTWFAGFLVTPL